MHTVHNATSLENVTALKIQLNSQFFMVAIVLMLWTIWKARNELIFNNNQINPLISRRAPPWNPCPRRFK
jgi:hypothetical protein